MNTTLKYGLLAGVLTSAVLVGLHFISFELSQSFSGQLFFGLVFPIIFMVLAIKAERQNQEGFISFGEGLKTAFLVYMISALIIGISQYVLYQTFTDDTWTRIVDMQRANAEGIMKMVGGDQVAMDDALDQEFTIDKMKSSMSGIGAFMIGLFGNAIIGLIVSLIVAAIMKRNPNA